MAIEKLDTSKIIIPVGYVLTKDPTVLAEERLAKERAEIEERIANSPEPSIEELAEYGRLYHPYYDDLRRLNEL